MTILTASERVLKPWRGQLWWIIRNLNPLTDVLHADEFLRDHPDSHAVRLAQAQCGALKQCNYGG